jgi:nucleoside-diphosphate-sugar epimerase
MQDTGITVAVTGAAGFLGSHICRALLRCGYAVRAVTREGSSRKFPDDLSKRVELRPADVRNAESLNSAFQNADVVVHNAAIVTVDADPEGLTEAVI